MLITIISFLGMLIVVILVHELGHFVTAKAGYSSPEDQQRVDDLILLVRGLAAYAAGDPDVARKYWKQITSPELRFSVDKAVREARQNGLARR